MNKLINKQWSISALWGTLGYIHDTINNLKCEKNTLNLKKKYYSNHRYLLKHSNSNTLLPTRADSINQKGEKSFHILLPEKQIDLILLEIFKLSQNLR